MSKIRNRMSVAAHHAGHRLRTAFGDKSTMAVYLAGAGDLTDCGYHRLLDTPEIQTCINRIAMIVSGATIYLMENGKSGDKRVVNALSRAVDIDPWPNMGTRQSWLSWIVSTMLGDGDGNAFVLPHYAAGKLAGLEPMPGAAATSEGGPSYRITWQGQIYAPDEVLHFRLGSDPRHPYKGKGVRVQAETVARSLRNTNAVKQQLSSPRYKPPMAVFVNSDTDLGDDDKREAFRARYLEDAETGKPWILPGDLVKIESLKPLSLSDLAIKDTLDMDKRTAAAIYGVPLFFLGLGGFSRDEFNTFVQTIVLPICLAIEQELTLKLLISPNMYFKFNRRRLYCYDMMSLIQMDLAMAAHGLLNGDEVREDADRDPVGLTEYTMLENYIPVDMLGLQNKLTPRKGAEANE